jgi:hypothetical protein
MSFPLYSLLADRIENRNCKGSVVSETLLAKPLCSNSISSIVVQVFPLYRNGLLLLCNRLANPLSRKRSYTRAPIFRLSSSTSQYYSYYYMTPESRNRRITEALRKRRMMLGYGLVIRSQGNQYSQNHKRRYGGVFTIPSDTKLYRNSTCGCLYEQVVEL